MWLCPILVVVNKWNAALHIFVKCYFYYLTWQSLLTLPQDKICLSVCLSVGLARYHQLDLSR